MKNKKKSLAMTSHKKKGIIIGCAVGGVAAIGLATGLGVGLTQCNSKTDLTREYNMGNSETKPDKAKIITYIQGEDARTKNMGQDDFDWTGPSETEAKLIVKGANKDYKGTIIVNYTIVKPAPTEMSIDGPSTFTTAGGVSATYTFEQTPDSKPITDATYEIIESQGTASKLHIDENTGKLEGTLTFGDTGSFTVRVASATYNLHDDLECEIKVPKVDPTNIRINGQKTFTTAGGVNKTYTFEQTPNSETITDATFSLENQLDAGNKLYISPKGWLVSNEEQELQLGDTGSFTVHVESATYNLHDDLECTINVPKNPPPTEITINGEETFTTAGGVNEIYTFEQTPNSETITDATFSLENQSGAVSKLSITTAGVLSGTLATGDTGYFEVVVVTATYPSLFGFLTCHINIKPTPTYITIKGQEMFDTVGSVNETYTFEQTNDSYPITDATYEIIESQDAASKLRIDENTGKLEGTLTFDDTGSFTVRVASATYNLHDDLECTIKVLPAPTGITIKGQEMFDTVGSVNETYTFEQTNDSYPITDATYEIIESQDAASKLRIDENTGKLEGILTFGDTGSFTVRVASATYNLHDDLECTIKVLPAPTNIIVFGTITLDTVGSVNVAYSFGQTPLGSYPITDATFTLEHKIETGQYLSITSNGKLTSSKDFTNGDTGSFTVHVESATYNLHDDLKCTIAVNTTPVTGYGRVTLNNGKQITVATPTDLQHLSNIDGPEHVITINGESFKKKDITGFVFGPEFKETRLPDYFLDSCSEFNQQFIIPSCVTTIGAAFLRNCISFNQDLEIPDTIHTIGSLFLEGCQKFNKYFIIPHSVGVIGSGFLKNCTDFESDILCHHQGKPERYDDKDAFSGTHLIGWTDYHIHWWV